MASPVFKSFDAAHPNRKYESRAHQFDRPYTDSALVKTS
jgi:hypothetical protein